jgi:Ca2+-transporting ATPase
VIRGGQHIRIAGREVVRGDLVLLAEGDRVPADAILRRCADLQTDESLLTGESVPVRKNGRPGGMPQAARPGGDDSPFVYSGTLVVRGQGVGEVIATGPRSEIGKIAQSLTALKPESPRLQTELRKVVRPFAAIGISVSVLAVILYGTLRGGWLEALLNGIALGMSMLPEEFPVILTVFMAMGAWRISRARVLTRKGTAIETLGSATVLCTDKTGTLTQNRMSVAQLQFPDGSVWHPDPASALPGNFQQLAEFALLASASEPFDPMERAFHDLAAKHVPHRHGLQLVRAYPLRPELLAMSHVWRTPEGEHLIAAKGAPEAVAALCRFDQTQTDRLRGIVDQMGTHGQRVLAVARGKPTGFDWPQSQREFDFEFLGLVGLADPLRPRVPDAVAECRSAGIRVVMITGDYPATARAISSQAGIEIGEVVTGPELDKLDQQQLAERLSRVTIFARILPEQKLRIVKALKQCGEIVAMTGDGVNDAPSLRAAHIGVAMGARGTDVAREASAIVLLDDDFASIVHAIRLGRRIYDNIRKALGFVTAVHVPIAGVALLPVIFGLPSMLGPVHIAFLEMVIDPICSLVFEAEKEERDIMRRPPRSPTEPLFGAKTIAWSLVQGTLVFVLAAGAYLIGYERGMPENEIRALVYFALVFSILSLVFVNRSFSTSLITALTKPNAALMIVLAAVSVVLAASLLWPSASELFRFGPLHADDLMITVICGAAVLLILEILKPRFAAGLYRTTLAAR